MIKAIDFFCGAGGLTRGLLDVGIKVLAGVDLDEGLRATYQCNNRLSRFIHADIKKINITQLRSDLGINKADTVLYAACTPCQPFSTLNQMKGCDDRKELLLSFAALVEKSPPDFILVENVPGLNTAYGREVYEKFISAIKRAGFNNIQAEFLDARDYGVPQVRKRFILMASRHGRLVRPKKVRRIPTVGECIAKYPVIADGASSDLYFNHEARLLMPHHKAIVQAVPLNGGSRSDVKDTSLLLKCHQKNPKAHKDVFGRMKSDGQAPTLTCRCTDVYCGRFTHPIQNRGISLREAAALQTFRDDYKFEGVFMHIAKQIGNAVPVNLARQLGESVRRSSMVSDKRHQGVHKNIRRNTYGCTSSQSNQQKKRLRSKTTIQTKKWLRLRSRLNVQVEPQAINRSTAPA